MNKALGFISKYKYILIAFLLILIIVFLIITQNKVIEIITYRSSEYELKYDQTWSIKESNDKKIALNHKKDGTVKIEIVDLESDYKLKNLTELIDELLYNFESQNESYKLIAKEETKLTKYEYEGYKALYESETSQALVAIAKNSDQIVIYVYESPNETFDILLDSAYNILNEFKILEENFQLNSKFDIETSNIDWTVNEEVKANIKNNKAYRIANENYIVNYEVPELFKISEYNSRQAYFNTDLKTGDIILSINIRNRNIYEYLDKEGGFSSLFGSYDSMRDGKYNYKDFKENLSISDGDTVKYIYKNSYNSGEKFNYENVIVVYELDKSHIITFEVKGTNATIPIELIEKIKITSSNNYANYIESEVKDNLIISQLKEYTTYKKDETRIVTLKIDKKYTENDIGQNVYKKRSYGLNYNSNLEVDDYTVNYELSLSLKSNLEIIKSSHSIYKSRGSYQELSYTKDVTVNGRLFKVYEGGFNEYSGAMFSGENRKLYRVNTKVLFHEFSDGKCLSIEIRGADVKITDELINELVNFDIETKK